MSHIKTGNNYFSNQLAKLVRRLGKEYHTYHNVRNEVSGKEELRLFISHRRPSEFVDKKFAI